MARRPLPWPSTVALLAIIRLALATAPLAALARIGTLLRGKRLRAWHQLGRLAARHPLHYRRWRERFLPVLISRWIGEDAAAVRVSVVALPAEGHGSLLQWAEAAGNTDWLVPVLPGDAADPNIAGVVAAAVARHQEAAVIYWDEDVAGSEGPAQPWIKPGWDPLLHRARDCLTGAAALNRQAVLAVLAALPGLAADAAGLAELFATLLAGGVVPVHVPLVLTSRGSPREVPAHAPALLARHWPGWSATSRLHGFLQLSPPAPAEWPSVSIIIPTRDRADLLASCLAGLARLDYPAPVEIIVVDNGSTEPAALALLAAAADSGQIRLVHDAGPFNFSRLNNRAAADAKGQYLCLLNNDVEAVDGGWLAHLVRHAAQPGVGAVGAQLLYPDGSIQHAGVAIGLGDAAGHIQRGADPDGGGHFGWHGVSRTVSAVTAACLLVSARDYARVGGLDEEGFAVAFNDVDFCLRLRASGRSIVYCAEARLIHAESRTRPRDDRPDQQPRFLRELRLLQARWHTAAGGDPHFSPLLDRASEACLLALA